MSDKRLDWEFNKNIDGLELIINFKNDQFNIDVFYDQQNIFSNHKKESYEVIFQILQSMASDSKFNLLKILTEKATNYLRYINDNFSDIGNSTCNNATDVLNIANESFGNILNQIIYYIKSPLEQIKKEDINLNINEDNQKQINNTLSLLLRKFLIVEMARSDGKVEYWLDETSSIPKLMKSLQKMILDKIIQIPDEKTIEVFVIKYIKTKAGGDIEESLRQWRHKIRNNINN